MVDKTKQYAFYFDQTRCMGCQTCVVACKDWNGIEPGQAKLRNLHDKELGDFPKINVFMTVYACNHCQNPACLDACPYDAIYKRHEDGIVIIDRDKCQGNGACKTACPYDAPQIPDDNQEKPTLALSTPTKGHKMMKCTMCYDRLAAGLKPACVGACLTRAIDVDTISEIERKYPEAQTIKSSSIVGFPSDDTGSDGNKLEKPTVPSFYFKPKMA